MLWVMLIGLSDANHIKIPYSKIEKSIKKHLTKHDISLVPVEVGGDQILQSEILEITVNNVTTGYVYVGRVNSCRAGGCSVLSNDDTVEFEYFDYFLIADSSANVVNVKVFNYQATHGHQIMSRGWLRQFVGYGGDQSLKYGKDIQAISGATVSAKTLIDDIEEAGSLLHTLYQLNIKMR